MKKNENIEQKTVEQKTINKVNQTEDLKKVGKVVVENADAKQRRIEARNDMAEKAKDIEADRQKLLEDEKAEQMKAEASKLLARFEANFISTTILEKAEKESGILCSGANLKGYGILCTKDGDDGIKWDVVGELKKNKGKGKEKTMSEEEERANKNIDVLDKDYQKAIKKFANTVLDIARLWSILYGVASAQRTAKTEALYEKYFGSDDVKQN